MKIVAQYVETLQQTVFIIHTYRYIHVFIYMSSRQKKNTVVYIYIYSCVYKNKIYNNYKIYIKVILI